MVVLFVQHYWHYELFLDIFMFISWNLF